MSEQEQRLLNYKKKEAIFRKTVRAAHQLFCNCGDPVQHLLGWRTIGGGEGLGTQEEHVTEGTGGADTALDALIAAMEEGG